MDNDGSRRPDSKRPAANHAAVTHRESARTGAAHDEANPITVFVVDDHELVRVGVTAQIDAEPDMMVVGDAGTAETAIGRIIVTAPDVVVLDVNLPDRTGIEVCRELRDRCPSTRSLMFTSFGDDEALFDAVIAGAAGYVLKHIGGRDFIECIRRVAAGESLIDHAAAVHLRERIQQGSADPALAALTGQESRILALLADGLTNREIASHLFLSEKTVKNYVSSLLLKLGMARRSEAAALAARLEARRDAYVRSMTDLHPVRF
jgi:DNA-binding NarL/FixJ family response regulator